MRNLFLSPRREWGIVGLVAVGLCADVFFHARALLLVTAVIGSLLTFWGALRSLLAVRMTLDTFNTLALAISFATGEIRSAAFIVLMLTSAELLEWHTERRTGDAIRRLLRLRPLTAIVERGGEETEVAVNKVRVGDTVILRQGARVPVDGTVVWGSGAVNEAPVTGESMPVEKIPGDAVVSGTLNEQGVLKIRATGVGAQSTIERMAELMRQAAQHKSRSEKVADRFAGLFLPVVIALGVGTYVITRDLRMTAAILLVACADDMAVAIPLAVTASLGRAAKRGVLIKGGQWLDVLSRTAVLVLDKTGTLTFGSVSVRHVDIAPHVPERQFWRVVGIGEKFSEHPIGRAMFRSAVRRAGMVPDPSSFEVKTGAGVVARYGPDEYIIGNEKIFDALNRPMTDYVRHAFRSAEAAYRNTTFVVLQNGEHIGTVSVSDEIRPEARASVSALRAAGVHRVVMFTGDAPAIAQDIARDLGIKEVRAGMKPEEKVAGIESLMGPSTVVAMVGDGINDAPALTRADVGIAVGQMSAGIAMEAADIVILSGDLRRVSEMINLGRHTNRIIRGDIVIWILTNLLGFTLVFTGVFGPAFAAFYNFITDFFPLMNSTRLFKATRN